MLAWNLELHPIIIFYQDVELLKKMDAKTWITATHRPLKEAWRLNHFVYTPMDMGIICEKALAAK